jgi:hypothetical protein
MVQRNITTVNKQLNGERLLTIGDPHENSNEVQAELNSAAQAAEVDAERDDDGDANVEDIDDDAPAGFQSNDYDESILLGLMGMIDMTLE